MDAFNESKSEFEKRCGLVIHSTSIYLQPLVEIIVEYVVTRYQLFEEAMLFKHHHYGDHGADLEHDRLLKELRLLSESNSVVLQYIRDIGAIEPGRYNMLYPALGLTVQSGLCNRIACYFTQIALVQEAYGRAVYLPR